VTVESLASAIALAALAALGTAPAVYLGALAILSIHPRTEPRGALASATPRFTFLVPAHNEEATLPVLLASISALDYPRDRHSVYVVADNCEDATAAVARAMGATVYERTDAINRGKGAALNWLMDQIASHEPPEAFIFVDADTTLSPNFLHSLADALPGGEAVLQAVNLISDSSLRPLSTARVLAFELMCHLRSLAFSRLGVSVGLHGNGMCFTPGMLRAARWEEDAVVEDGTLHLSLVERGIRVRLARNAVLRSKVPGTLSSAYGQAVRWERGKFDLFGRAMRMIGVALGRRDASALTAGLEVLLPPFAIVLAALGVEGLWGISGNTSAFALSALGIVFAALYVGRGIILTGFGPVRVVRLAAFGPLYVAWKLFVLARAAQGAGRGQWIRSERPAD
jgi:cellulose synthase/poly-beta-1,6-N-acetylglucosamine synthase-like glycosyltransferase